MRVELISKLSRENKKTERRSAMYITNSNINEIENMPKGTFRGGEQTETESMPKGTFRGGEQTETESMPKGTFWGGEQTETESMPKGTFRGGEQTETENMPKGTFRSDKSKTEQIETLVGMSRDKPVEGGASKVRSTIFSEW